MIIVYAVMHLQVKSHDNKEKKNPNEERKEMKEEKQQQKRQLTNNS